jgi:hypothetical protein
MNCKGRNQCFSLLVIGFLVQAKAFTSIQCFSLLVIGFLVQAKAFTSIQTANKHRSSPLWNKNDGIDDFWRKFPSWSDDKPSDTLTTDNTSGLLQTIEVVTAPVQEILDEYSSGWAFSYADLRPDTSATTPGRIFLATNLAYLLAGLVLQFQGANELGLATDLCAAFSFQYHYQQLEVTNTVRAALLLDYVFAAFAMGLATFYLVTSVAVTSLFTMNVAVAVGLAVVSLGCLGLSWKFEYGQPYMFFHGLWHLASAGAGYAIGDLHNSVM